MSKIANFLKDESGATAAEYALILSLIALAPDSSLRKLTIFDTLYLSLMRCRGDSPGRECSKRIRNVAATFNKNQSLHFHIAAPS